LTLSCNCDLMGKQVMAALLQPADVSRPASFSRQKSIIRIAACMVALLIVSLLVWRIFPRPDAQGTAVAQRESASAVLDIGVLVFREGLECILVLAAITASMVGSRQAYQRPIAAGAAIAFLATLVTWGVAVRIVNDLTTSLPALDVQVVTGLLAIIVLVVVMNWFFHKVYWTGWISMHNKRKHDLLGRTSETGASRRILWGFVLLGFTSLYREGVEVVLFLQSYRLKLGGRPVLYGVVLGLCGAGLVAFLTFVAHRRLPYRRMLVLTGVLLGVVLLVMVGEQAQEMQQAHWLPTTTIAFLNGRVPDWMGLWFSVFPTIETLAAQGIAAVLVLGSYFLARESSAS
jgi:high-affinity iron transporter